MIFFRKFTIQILLSILICSTLNAQNYPNKIRGYKVYQAEISVKTEKNEKDEKSSAETYVKLGEPELTDISLPGITLEIPAEIEGVEQSGKVDFLAFEDFKINGLNVEIEEYQLPFEFKKGEKIILPKPVKIFLSTGQAFRGAFKELKESKADWTVSGKVFVFGKFKKFGFNFRRVVPVEINLKIENPLKKKLAQIDESKSKK